MPCSSPDPRLHANGSGRETNHGRLVSGMPYRYVLALLVALRFPPTACCHAREPGHGGRAPPQHLILTTLPDASCGRQDPLAAPFAGAVAPSQTWDEPLAGCSDCRRDESAFLNLSSADRPNCQRCDDARTPCITTPSKKSPPGSTTPGTRQAPPPMPSRHFRLSETFPS